MPHPIFEYAPIVGTTVMYLAAVACLLIGRSHGRRAIAASKAEAAEYDRALRDYEQLMRHRIANPLTVVSGGVATLREHGERLDAATRGLLLDDIAAALDRLDLVETVPTTRSAEEACLDAVPHVAPRVLAVA